jgi:hypothetical protein
MDSAASGWFDRLLNSLDYDAVMIDNMSPESDRTADKCPTEQIKELLLYIFIPVWITFIRRGPTHSCSTGVSCKRRQVSALHLNQGERCDQDRPKILLFLT